MPDTFFHRPGLLALKDVDLAALELRNLAGLIQACVDQSEHATWTA